MELDINFHLVETPGPGGKPLLLLLFGPCILNSLYNISQRNYQTPNGYGNGT